ncbi:MAG: hypothetical protein J5958_05505 [Clostridia bacterium]|nr:hypothetical protein [Clostridia bacterium]
MKIKRRTRNTILLIAGILLAVSVLGMVTQGFQKWKPADVKETALSKILKERNPDNLIDEIELEDGKDVTSDISYKVDKYGRVTLNGTASATSAVVYATVELEAGTYYLTGDDVRSSNKTAYLAIFDSSNNQVKRADMGAFTVSETATYTIRIVVFEDGVISNYELAPVLSTAEDTPFFAEK